MHYTIYHNPRCSKSREALSLLQAQNASINVIEYLKQPLSLAQLRTLLQQIGGDAKSLLRSGDDDFVQLNVDITTLSDDDILSLLEQKPSLLQRPIVDDGQRAVIARPPEVLHTWLR
jgi:arsenate reductase